ncbi:MAG: hypothetical protein U5L05_15855 [Rubrivivax sp.]|nr:hypothetical protein [Rubrivivax sp.]
MNPTPALNDAEQQALAVALDDEYKSHETYQQVIRDFGPARPFINSVEAEARHISALLALLAPLALFALFAKYAVAPPANRWAGKAPRHAGVHDACVAGVQGETDNVVIYDGLLLTTQRSDLLDVLHALRSASQDRHLPTFQRCARRG